MAYRDPYAERYGRYDEQYTDTPGFNPYASEQPHQPYDQGGYDSYGAGGHRDDTNYGQSSSLGASAFVPAHQKGESVQYDQAAFARATTEGQPRSLKHWRFENHGGLWAKGSRATCIGRFCCCTLMITVFLIVSILLPLALWIRPPNIVVGSVQAASNGSEIQSITNGIQLNLEVPIQYVCSPEYITILSGIGTHENDSVNNPNYFSVSFSSIKANIYYPINNTLIGGGQESAITFHSHTNTTFTFPFLIEYTTTMSSSAQIITDLVQKCGITGGTASDITVDYDITLALRVVFFTVTPTISNSASFLCPLTASDITGLSSVLTGSG